MRTRLVYNDKFEDEDLYLLQQHYEKIHKTDVKIHKQLVYKDLFQRQRGVFSQANVPNVTNFIWAARIKKQFSQTFPAGGMATI